MFVQVHDVNILVIIVVHRAHRLVSPMTFHSSSGNTHPCSLLLCSQRPEIINSPNSPNVHQLKMGNKNVVCLHKEILLSC